MPTGTIDVEVTREDMDMPFPAAAPESGAADSPRNRALSNLVLQNYEASGLSYEKLAARAIDPDTGERLISRGYLQGMAMNPPAKAPKEHEIRGIAIAFRLPLRIVQKAAAEQYLGYVAVEVSGYGEDMRRIIGYLEGQSPSEIARWRAMMEASEQAQHEEE